MEEEGGSNQGGGVAGGGTAGADNTAVASPPVTKDLLKSVNNGSQNSNTQAPENDPLLGGDIESNKPSGEVKTSGNDNIKGNTTNTPSPPLAELRDKSIEIAGEKTGESLKTSANKELSKMSSEGYMKTNTGKLVKTSRMKEVEVNGEKVKRPVNFGYKRNGVVHTTKGINLHTSKTTFMKQAGGVLKHSGRFFDLLTLSKVALGKEAPYKALDIILPTSIITDEQFAEIDLLHLETALKEGYERTVNLLENSNIPAKLIYVSAEELKNIQSGSTSQVDQLSDPGNKNQNYGLLVDTNKQFKVYGGFYLGK